MYMQILLKLFPLVGLATGTDINKISCGKLNYYSISRPSKQTNKQTNNFIHYISLPKNFKFGMLRTLNVSNIHTITKYQRLTHIYTKGLSLEMYKNLTLLI